MEKKPVTELEKLRLKLQKAKIEALQKHLTERDDFIISKGLWHEFVDTYPSFPRKADEGR